MSRTALWFAVFLAGCGDQALVLTGVQPLVLTGVQPPEPPMTSQGGPILSRPTVYTVVWSGDEALGATLDTFHNDIFKDHYWSVVTAEYGVGPGVAAGVLVVPGARARTLDDAGLQSVAQALVDAHEIPMSDDTVIDFILPSDLSTFDGMTLPDWCTRLLGYHDELAGELTLPYIVNLQCAVRKRSPMDELTIVDSHELIEVATDPHYNTMPAWQNIWLGGSGEIGDLCNDIHRSVTITDPHTITYAVARSYSAKIAAAAKDDPCTPALTTPYYNIGVTPSNILITSDSKGNGTATVTLDAFTWGAPTQMQWSAFTYFSTVTITPVGGLLSPGESTEVTIHSTGSAQPYPGVFVVMVANPSSSTVWTQEWVAALTIN